MRVLGAARSELGEKKQKALKMIDYCSKEQGPVCISVTASSLKASRHRQVFHCNSPEIHPLTWKVLNQRPLREITLSKLFPRRLCKIYRSDVWSVPSGESGYWNISSHQSDLRGKKRSASTKQNNKTSQAAFAWELRAKLLIIKHDPVLTLN